MQRNTGYFPTESLEPSGNRLFSRSALNEGDLFRGSLNIAPLTGTLSGMQAGAQQYFGKDASQLTLAESATLASIPRSPVAYSPYSNPEKLLERRNWVLKLMLDQERISQADYDAAAAAPPGGRSRHRAESVRPPGGARSRLPQGKGELLFHRRCV